MVELKSDFLVVKEEIIVFQIEKKELVRFNFQIIILYFDL